MIMTESQMKCIEECRTIVQKRFRDDVSGHDWEHMKRVENMADRIAGSVAGPDTFRLKLTALLHDLDDRKLSPDTAQSLANADRFLSAHSDVVTEELRTAILDDIRKLPFSGGQTPESIEGRIVQDADRLDALGAVGIARLFAFGGAHGIKLYDPDIPPTHKPGCDSTSINHFYEKILKIEPTLNTKMGRVIARQRTRYMREFLERFMAEQEPQNTLKEA